MNSGFRNNKFSFLVSKHFYQNSVNRWYQNIRKLILFKINIHIFSNLIANYWSFKTYEIGKFNRPRTWQAFRRSSGDRSSIPRARFTRQYTSGKVIIPPHSWKKKIREFQKRISWNEYIHKYLISFLITKRCFRQNKIQTLRGSNRTVANSSASFS